MDTYDILVQVTLACAVITATVWWFRPKAGSEAQPKEQEAQQRSAKERKLTIREQKTADLYGIGIDAMQEGKWGEAQVFLLAALQLTPTCPVIHTQLGKLLIQAHKSVFSVVQSSTERKKCMYAT